MSRKKKAASGSRSNGPKWFAVFYGCFGAYFVLLVILYLNGYFVVEEKVAVYPGHSR